MKRNRIEIITAALTLLLLSFSIGYFAGRKSIDAPITVSVERPVSSAAPLPAAASPSPTSADAVPPSAPININTASAEALTALPGIGEVLAQRIVDYRAQHGAFAATADLMDIRGIGDAIFSNIKDYITVD